MTDSEEYPPIKFLRLRNGDDIVSEVVEIGDDETLNYMLINPYKIMYMDTANRGYVQVAFMPWVFSRICDKQEFIIKEDDVVVINDVSDYMVQYYWNSIDGSQQEEQASEPEEEKMDNLSEILESLGIASKRTLH